MTLSVADDGLGVPDVVPGGSGLTNMALRAEQLGGTCTIARQTLGGTLITWQAPLATPTPDPVG